LLYRLAWPAMVGIAALAGRGFGDRWPLALVLLLEARLVSPAWNLPEHTDARPASSLVGLAAAPPGAVMNWPVMGGRSYLYEQTFHGKPLAATLNFPNNAASKRVWRAATEAMSSADEAFRTAVVGAARSGGVRYLVLHEDPVAGPDDHDALALRIAEVFGATGEGTRVVAFW
jgi:hypothetical protein